MDFDYYQEATGETAIYPEGEETEGVPIEVFYTATGLAGEAGEVQEKVKKAIREDEEKYLDQLEDELGDVLWYLARLSDELDLDFSEVADDNLSKLMNRKERDKLTGQGDYR